MPLVRSHLPLLIAGIVALAPACLPSFESVECYNDFDCPQDFVCTVDFACAQSTRDGGVRDGGFEDAGSLDASAPDATPDAGFQDAATPRDAGFADSGVMDAETPDMGTPDAGFDVRLTPASIDYGVVRLGCAVPMRQAVLQNAGPTPVQITSIGPAQGTSGEFASDARATPFTLMPAASELIDVTYTPNNTGVDVGALDVTWGTATDIVSSNLRAEGVLAGARTDNFTQVGGPIDILFIVDDSPGMAGFQQQLGSDVTFLMLTLAFEGWDYQIGVTTADLSATGPAGNLLGMPAFITPQTANAEQVLATRLAQGASGDLVAEGMEASRLALSPPLSTTGTNMGFLRANAALLVIYLSNDDDDSSMMVSAYAAFLNGLKGAGNANRVAANVIVADVTACSGPAGTANFAGRYLGLAPLTGGIIENICGNSYQDAVSTMPPIDRNRRFALSAVAEPGTVSVIVDGSAVPSNGGANWTFEVAGNEVVFSADAAPELGLSVRIDYTIECN